MKNSSSNWVSNLALATALASLPASANSALANIDFSTNSSFQSNHYSSSTSSTVQTLAIEITNDALFELEVSKIENFIYQKFGTKVIATWIPEKNFQKKSCLFVKCEIQNKFKDDFEKLSEFEYKLYVELKDTLNESNYFNMIAIL